MREIIDVRTIRQKHANSSFEFLTEDKWPNTKHEYTRKGFLTKNILPNFNSATRQGLSTETSAKKGLESQYLLGNVKQG